MPRDATYDAIVRQLRDAVIDNDLKFLQAMNQRLVVVARLREFKERHEVEFVDPSREEWMHRYLQGANKGPISPEGLRELYEHVLELTKRETARAAAAADSP